MARKVLKIGGIVVGSVVLLGGIVVGSAAIYEAQRGDTIADGVTVAGIPLDGKSPGEAKAELRNRLQTRLSRPVTVTVEGRRFVWHRENLGVRPAVDSLVDQAVAASRSGNFLSRAARDISGGTEDAHLPLRFTYSQARLAGFVGRVARAVDRPARDASITFTTSALLTRPGSTGVTLDQAALTRRLARIVPAIHPKPVVVRTTVVKPKVTMAELSSQYPTVITVDRGSTTLRLFKDLKEVRSYPIAVGQAGLETPAGLYHIQDKQVNPSWHVPNSAWAGSLAGQVIPPGPQDPIKSRWMGIFNGAGIHGTDELSSLGTAASHGCIRMAIPDVDALYDQTPLHTPVYIQ
jgi:lipoprotein-anchoring transpeptidase ErfK/SrfK